MHTEEKPASMKRGILIAMILPILALPTVLAGNMQDLEQEIEEVRTRIEKEEETRNLLREDLASMDEKVDTLRQRLDELEARIAEEKESE